MISPTAHLTRHTPAEVKKNWVVLDAKNQILGNVAAKAAHYLRGKHKGSYTTHIDDGDYVIIINAEKIAISGDKARNKFYYFHSNHPGGIKGIRYDEMLAKHPERVLELAVKGMIRNHRLGRKQVGNLRVYAGETHPHAAHKPVSVAM